MDDPTQGAIKVRSALNKASVNWQGARKLGDSESYKSRLISRLAYAVQDKEIVLANVEMDFSGAASGQEFSIALFSKELIHVLVVSPDDLGGVVESWPRSSLEKVVIVRSPDLFSAPDRYGDEQELDIELYYRGRAHPVVLGRKGTTETHLEDLIQALPALYDDLTA